MTDSSSILKPAKLREMRDRPFELLAEMDRRARDLGAVTGADGGQDREWVGVAFAVSGQPFLADREHVREVLTCPATTRVPGARQWIRGLANVRGQLLPVIDLKAFLGGIPVPVGRNTRLISIHHKTVPAGLIVDEVLGFRRFLQNERQAAESAPLPGLEGFVTESFVRGAQTWPVVDLHRLVESERFLNAAE